MIAIGDMTFEIQAPGAMDSFSEQQRIIPVAGRVVGVFMRLLGMAPDSDVGKLMGQDVLKVLPQAMPYIGEVFAAMPPGELKAITGTLLARGTANIKGAKVPLFGPGPVDAIDALMAGRTMDMWKLLWHALEVWYPDFFARGRALFVKGERATASMESTT